MADSSAARAARYRRHKQGDHSMCTRRCKDSAVGLTIAGVPAGSGEDLDPEAGLRDLAAVLAAAYAADPGNASLARELRATLLVLRPPQDAGVVDELEILGKFMRTPVKADGRWDDLG